MKKNILLKLLFALYTFLFLPSCSEENHIERYDYNSKKEFSLVEEKTYRLLKNIYSNSFNGDYIDLESFGNVITKECNLTQEDFYSLLSTYTRTIDIDSNDYGLPSEVKPLCDLLTKYLKDKVLSREEETDLLLQAKKLSKENEELFYIILGATNSSILALNRINNEISPTRAGFFERGWKKNLGIFACNIATGGIGSVYGGAAAAISVSAFATSAVVTGGVSVVVGLAVSGILATVCC
ncbi:MAG: hypothetical protein Q3992_01125 [Bacteroides sp.]|nr:hypothetical protein [Bacteroides sp.]